MTTQKVPLAYNPISQDILTVTDSGTYNLTAGQPTQSVGLVSTVEINDVDAETYRFLSTLPFARGAQNNSAIQFELYFDPGGANEQILVSGQYLISSDEASVQVETIIPKGTLPTVSAGNYTFDLRLGAVVNQGNVSLLNGHNGQSAVFRTFQIRDTLPAVVAPTASSLAFSFSSGVAIEEDKAVQNRETIQVLFGASTALSQQPTGLGDANRIKIEFGSDQFGVNDPVMLTNNGTRLTFNQPGLYWTKPEVIIGRTGGAGESNILFRALVNGAQTALPTQGFLVDNQRIKFTYSEVTWIYIPPGGEGTYIELEMCRDPSGDNSGGLFQDEVTATGWNPSSCATVQVLKFL